MSWAYSRRRRAVLHRTTGARLPLVPMRLGRLMVARLRRLRGVETKAEAQNEITWALVQVAHDALRGRK